MNNLPLRNLTTLAFALLFFFGAAHSQTPGPQSTTAPRPGAAAKSAVVTQVDDESLPKILKPNGKPLLVNFWATWCDPCREEFPELVKIDADYKGKIDFITVTLDEP